MTNLNLIKNKILKKELKFLVTNSLKSLVESFNAAGIQIYE